MLGDLTNKYMESDLGTEILVMELKSIGHYTQISKYKVERYLCDLLVGILEDFYYIQIPI